MIVSFHYLVERELNEAAHRHAKAKAQWPDVAQRSTLRPDQMARSNGTVTQDTLDEIVRRVVEVAQPEKIVLFGSAAGGEMGPNSDVDLLVVKAGAHRLDLSREVYANLHGLDEAVDLVVVTPEDIERYGSCHALVIAPALREGRVLYGA